MSCYCDEAPEPTMYSTKYRTARKAHLCAECGKADPIQPGERYVEITMVVEGAFIRARLHEECEAEWQELEALGYCGDLGTLEETRKEAWA